MLQKICVIKTERDKVLAHILVVDDDSQVRSILSEALTRYGYTVSQAGNGLEALEQLAKRAFDVLLVDIVMPEKEGIETIMEVRHKFPAVLIIAMSGGSAYTSPHTNLQIARRIGADIVLSKPFTQAELFVQIDAALKKQFLKRKL